MAEIVSVNFSGPALAFLLYENVKSRNEQEGFLLGETNVIVTRTITDSDSHNEKLHKIININAVVPCPRTCSFYDSSGKLDTGKLESILGSEITNVVAWFKYEPVNRFQLSMRDKLVHIELSNSGLFPIPTDLFSCCVLSSTNSLLESTNSYTHAFLRYKNNYFINVPLHISNLGESSSCYKPKVQASKPFSELCQSIGVPKKGVFDLKLIDKIQDKLHNEVNYIMKDLTESENIKEDLEQEYQNMKLEMEYYSSLLEEKALADARANEEKRRLVEQEELEKQMLSLLDLDINKLSEDESETKKDKELEVLTNKSLKNDLELTQDTNKIKKVENKETNLNKNVNEKNISKNKTLEDQVKTEKTEKEDLLNTSFGSNRGDSALANISCTENLIDLTMEEEKPEEEYKLTTRSNKMSYAQIMSKKKPVQNS